MIVVVELYSCDEPTVDFEWKKILFIRSVPLPSHAPYIIA